MFKNYLRIAFRNLLKHKVFSLINLIGLAVGMAASMLIFRYIYYEMHYERFNKNSEHVYRVQVDRYQNNSLLFKSARSYPGLSNIFRDEMPEIVHTTMLFPESCLFRYEDNKISNQVVYWVDNSFIEIFDLKLIKSSSNDPLKNVFSAVLTQSAANRLFGDEDPIGKTVIQNEGNLFVINGVVEDYPPNSHIEFDYLLSMNSIPAILGMPESIYLNNLRFNWVPTYVQVRPDSSMPDLNDKLSQVVDKHFGFLKNANSRIELHLQPLRDIHLKSDLNGELSPNSNMEIIYSLFIMALIILIMAWINFINLSTSRALERAKEVGIRKVAGSHRMQIIGQFIFESIMLNIIAFLIALALMELLSPIANDITSSNVNISFFSFPQYWVLIFLFFVLCGVIAGLYPALLLSSFNPISIINARFKSTGAGGLIRKALVVFQFAAAVALIIGTLIISRQITFVQNQYLGFNSDQVLVINTPRTIIPTALKEDKDRRIRFFKRFKETLLKYPYVKEVSVADTIPGREMVRHTENVSKLGADTENSSFFLGNIELDFFKLLDIDIIAGRSFSKEIPSELQGIVVNEKAATMLGFNSADDALNETLIIRDLGTRQSKIIGVVSNYHQEHLRKTVEPIIYFYGQNYEFGYIMIKLETRDIPESMQSIRAHWSEIYPDDPFDNFFLDDFFNSQYAADRQLAKIVMVFSSLAIIIAVLGLYGLSSLSAVQRTKEVGIRKTFGASLPNLLYQLSRGFILLVLLANVIAWPIIYIIMDSWLNSFVLRIDISVFLFIIPCIIVLLIAMITICYNTVKVAGTNPVEALRYE